MRQVKCKIRPEENINRMAGNFITHVYDYYYDFVGLSNNLTRERIQEEKNCKFRGGGGERRSLRLYLDQPNSPRSSPTRGDILICQKLLFRRFIFHRALRSIISAHTTK